MLKNSIHIKRKIIVNSTINPCIMTTQQKLTTTLSSFQILYSKSGNIIKPPFYEEGNEINFGFDISENKASIIITSTSFCKKFFYRLSSRSNYEFEADNNLLITNLVYEDLLNSLTEMAQYSLKKHSNIFREFNYTGTFKHCFIEEKTFEELYLVTRQAIEINSTLSNFIRDIIIGEVPLQN
jgi:hypothetical protein